MDDDPISNALRTRRLPHGRFKTRGTNKATFDVFRAINEYEVTFGTGRSRARQRTGGDHKSFLTIHGLTPDENGLFATLKLVDTITAVAVLSGSRKELQHIVKSLEDDDDERASDPDERADKDSEEHSVEGGFENRDDANNLNEDDDSTDNDDDNKESDEQQDEVNDLDESPEDRRNRLTAAFAKNSFRNPKFWMRWQGNVRRIDSDETSTSPTPDLETDMAYIVFTENSCQTFEGTLTCKMLDWKNVKIRGDKVRSMGNETLDLSTCKEAWLTGRT